MVLANPSLIPAMVFSPLRYKVVRKKNQTVLVIVHELVEKNELELLALPSMGQRSVVQGTGIKN